jgi:hypothetical protein
MRLRLLLQRVASTALAPDAPAAAAAAMRAALPLRTLAPAARRVAHTAAASAPCAPRHATAGALTFSSFCPGSRALLHASARASAAVARTAVAPGATRAEASTFQDAGLDQELLDAVRARRRRSRRACAHCTRSSRPLTVLYPQTTAPRRRRWA